MWGPMTDRRLDDAPSPIVSVLHSAVRQAPNLFCVDNLPLDLHDIILLGCNSVDKTVTSPRNQRPRSGVVRQSRIGAGHALVSRRPPAIDDIINIIDPNGSSDPDEIPQFVTTLPDGAGFAKGTLFVKCDCRSDIRGPCSFSCRVLTRQVQNVACPNERKFGNTKLDSPMVELLEEAQNA
jgi:hypothetical protein